MVYSSLVVSSACVVAMVFWSVLAVGDKISANPVSALISGLVSEEMLLGWKAEAEAVLRDGFQLHSLESLHYAGEAMELILNQLEGDTLSRSNTYKDLCSKSRDVEVESLKDAYHLASLLRVLDCKQKVKVTKKDLVEQIGSVKSVKEILYATVAADKIKGAKVDINTFCTRVASAVKKGYDDPISTALFLVNMNTHEIGESGACKKLLDSTAKVLKNDLVMPGSDHPFFAPLFLFTMQNDQDRVHLSAARINLLASQLSGAAFARGDSIQTICVLASLRVLMSNNPPPIVVSIQPDEAERSSVRDGKVSVAITNIIGKPLEELTEVKVDNKKLQKNQDKWILSLGENTLLNLGNKNVKFDLNLGSYYGHLSVTQNLKLLAKVHATNLNIEKLEKGTNYPTSGFVFSERAGDFLLASFNIESQGSNLQTPTCHFIFEHLESGHRSYFTNVAEGSNSAGWECKIKLALKKESEKFLHRSGKYELCASADNEFIVANDKSSIVCGDVFIDFHHPSKGTIEPVEPLYTRPLLHASDNSLNALPEQHHTHTPSPPTPPAVVTLSFCGLAIVPLLVFVTIALRIIGPKLRYKGGDFFSIAGLHQACITGTILCLVICWFDSNFPVVRYTLPLISIVFLCTNHLTAAPSPSQK